MAASVQKYLSNLLPEHIRELVYQNHGLVEGDEGYDEEYQSTLNLFESSIWRDWDIIETAYYMNVPRKALYRFGYTDKEIDRLMAEFSDTKYPK